MNYDYEIEKRYHPENFLAYDSDEVEGDEENDTLLPLKREVSKI